MPFRQWFLLIPGPFYQPKLDIILIKIKELQAAKAEWMKQGDRVGRGLALTGHSYNNNFGQENKTGKKKTFDCAISIKDIYTKCGDKRSDFVKSREIVFLKR